MGSHNPEIGYFRQRKMVYFVEVFINHPLAPNPPISKLRPEISVSKPK
jgi:hypothetical protein